LIVVVIVVLASAYNYYFDVYILIFAHMNNLTIGIDRERSIFILWQGEPLPSNTVLYNNLSLSDESVNKLRDVVKQGVHWIVNKVLFHWDVSVLS